jgi:hypothetical protein
VRALAALWVGVRAARRHGGLGVAYYLVATAPALLVTIVVSTLLAPLRDSLFADRVLTGGWLPVWLDLSGGTGFPTRPVVLLVVLLGLGATLLCVLLAGGVVQTLLERAPRGLPTLLAGVVENGWRFLRAAACFTSAATLAVGLVGALAWRLHRLAMATGDARWDLVMLAVSGLLGLLLLGPLALAHDLSRLAAARHGQRSMVRGFVRALGAVLRRPALFAPLALLLLCLPLALHLGYWAARRPFTPAHAVSLALLLAAQQLVMLLRGLLKVVTWGSVLACYRELGEPELCRKGSARPAWARGPGELVATGQPSGQGAVAAHVGPIEDQDRGVTAGTEEPGSQATPGQDARPPWS